MTQLMIPNLLLNIEKMLVLTEALVDCLYLKSHRLLEIFCQFPTVQL